MTYRISSNNSRPSINRLPRIIASHLPPLLGYPLGIPMAVNFEGKAKVESDPAKLISDDSSCDAEDIDVNKLSRNSSGVGIELTFSLPRNFINFSQEYINADDVMHVI